MPGGTVITETKREHMLSTVTRARYLPRSNETGTQTRRFAELRAAVADLVTHIEKLQKDQDTQFRRIAQLQQDIDELRRLLKKVVADR
jgi:hypothetical protein